MSYSNYSGLKCHGCLWGLVYRSCSGFASPRLVQLPFLKTGKLPGSLGGLISLTPEISGLVGMKFKVLAKNQEVCESGFRKCALHGHAWF